LAAKLSSKTANIPLKYRKTNLFLFFKGKNKYCQKCFKNFLLNFFFFKTNGQVLRKFTDAFERDILSVIFRVLFTLTFRHFGFIENAKTFENSSYKEKNRHFCHYFMEWDLFTCLFVFHFSLGMSRSPREKLKNI